LVSPMAVTMRSVGRVLALDRLVVGIGRSIMYERAALFG